MGTGRTAGWGGNQQDCGIAQSAWDRAAGEGRGGGHRPVYTGLDMPLLLRAVQLLVLYDEQDVRAGVCSVEFFTV